MKVLCMKDPQLANEHATSFLSNTVGRQSKLNMKDVNCHKIIDRPVLVTGCTQLSDRAVR